MVAINIGVDMSSITIRNLDDKLKASLRLRPARHGLSIEQEVRNILQNTLAAEDGPANDLDCVSHPSALQGTEC
jgi:plasmid stability protein